LYRSADHHVWELVENEMVTQEESGNSHPVIMLTKTHAGTLARLHTVGDRYLDSAQRKLRPFVYERFLTCSHAQIGSLDPHTLTTTDANGHVAAGVGMHLHQESRYGVYVTALTPGGPGHFACPIGDSGVIPHECATMLNLLMLNLFFADPKSVFLLSAAEECGLIAQDDILRSVDGCVRQPCPLHTGAAHACSMHSNGPQILSGTRSNRKIQLKRSEPWCLDRQAPW